MQISIILLAVVGTFISAKAQQPDYGKMFIEAINQHSEEKRKEILLNCFSAKALTTPGIEAISGATRQLNQQFAPIEFHHAEVNEFKRPNGTVFVMHVYAQKKGQVMYQDFQIYLDPIPPHKLEKIAFVAEVAEPVNLPNGSIDQAETIAWLTRYAEKLNTENDLFGSFLITKGNQVLFEKQYGYENLEAKAPITRKTKFNMASGGKMFTAVAIAQLAENGKIRFEDPITKYVNGFSDKSKADKIKIKHLLSHTSGIAEYWSGQNNPTVFSATTIDQHLKIVYEAGLTFDAGTQYRYCNSNFIVLGAIIERASGKSFYDYVAENIFTRAGMLDTGYPKHNSPGLAITYVRDGNTWKPGVLGERGSSAGGAYSTLEDIHRFSRALRDNTLIKRETLADMTSLKNGGLEVTEEYGYGFIISRLGGEPAYGHGGTAKGVNFEFNYYPNQDITMILFNNQNNGAYDDLKKNIMKLITGYR